MFNIEMKLFIIKRRLPVDIVQFIGKSAILMSIEYNNLKMWKRVVEDNLIWIPSKHFSETDYSRYAEYVYIDSLIRLVWKRKRKKPTEEMAYKYLKKLFPHNYSEMDWAIKLNDFRFKSIQFEEWEENQLIKFDLKRSCSVDWDMHFKKEEIKKYSRSGLQF